MTSIEVILFLYFLIGFISDLFLNYLSRQSYSPNTVKALEIYFKRKSIKSELVRTIVSAFNAGLTILLALIVTMLLSKLLFGFYHPMRLGQLYKFILLAFVVGYIADVVIYKMQLFGESLNPYYKETGAGLWGAIAFIFSILTVYVLVKMFV